MQTSKMQVMDWKKLVGPVVGVVIGGYLTVRTGLDPCVDIEKGWLCEQLKPVVTSLVWLWMSLFLLIYYFLVVRQGGKYSWMRLLMVTGLSLVMSAAIVYVGVFVFAIGVALFGYIMGS
jgi:hypothetical protein